MATSNSKYEELLKQLSEEDYVLQDVEDNSKTFQSLFKFAVKNISEKRGTVQGLIRERMVADTEVKMGNRLISTLQERRIKLDEMIKTQNTEIAQLEKERDETIKKYMEMVDNLHRKLTSIEEEFQPESLKEQIVHLKKLEKEVESDIKEGMARKQTLEERLRKLKKELPSFQEIRQIRDQIFDGNDELGKRQRELDNLNTFINDLKAKQ